MTSTAVNRTSVSDPAPPARNSRRVSPAALLAAGVFVLVLACFVSVALGARPLSLDTVWQALTSPDAANGDHAVVLSRLPRTVMALLVGAALGLAGTALQGMTRNPLADPGIMGLNAGAAFAVVTAIYVFGVTSFTGYVWFALAGTALAALVVYSVAALGREGATPVKLALAGAALTAGLTSLLSAILVTSRQTLDTFRFWQVGTVSGRGWDVLVPLAPFLAAGAVILLASGRALNGLSLGDDVARGLGQRVNASRGIMAVGVVLLCGAATAAAGPIAFLGLVIPHLVRGLVGPDYRWILVLSAVLAPVLLLVSDVVGRLVLPPGEIPVGIMTAVIGAPVFIAIIRRRKLAEL
ncbi:FecCD family ABC transporter permease [Arthrobacter caoxuetaonis]|uniref:FecCD family ABC transporter permease n=1 Tax=Arthrobacter caoxuetaonis TaxID=2886935 RepID=UPI001D148D33|nr:iron ABC transporter permease [Arthrobacter caoxuetaonis]